MVYYDVLCGSMNLCGMHALAPVKFGWSSLVIFPLGSFDKVRVIIGEVLGVPDKLNQRKQHK